MLRRSRCALIFLSILVYKCIVITYSKGKDQPGKVASRARGQLAEQGKLILPCPRSHLRIWSGETGLAVPSRVSLLISIPGLNLALTYKIPPEFRGGDSILSVHITAGTFNMPTSYQLWVWEKEANINWSMVTCQGSTRSELP